jgi:hypothetical protein
MIKWKSFSFFMPNALPEIVRLQQRVFEILQEPLIQVEDTCTHGQFLTRTVREYIDQLDAVVFFDLDCIPLKPGVVERAVRLAVEREMIIGCAQQANYVEIGKILEKRKHWPVIIRKLDTARILLSQRLGIDPYWFYHFDDPLIYAGPCFLVVPAKVYNRVGRPTLDVTPRADAAGELTIACRERGVKVKCLQPTFCHVPKYKLGNVKRFGLGTVFGHSIFHAMETTYLSNKKSASLFEEYCKKVIQTELKNQLGASTA